MRLHEQTRWPPSQVLRSPIWRRFAAALWADDLADAVWLVTLGWVASSLDSPIQSGLVLCAGGLPMAVMALYGGVLADRFGTVRMAVLTLTVRVLILGLWALVLGWSDDGQMVLVTGALAVLIGAVAGVHAPAIAAVPVSIVPAQAQHASVTLERILVRAAQAAGGAIAGLALSTWGVRGPGWVAAGLAAIAWLLLPRLPRPRSLSLDPTQPIPAFRNRSTRAPVGVREGVDFVRHHPFLRRTVQVQAASNLVTAAALLATVPLRARELGWGPAQWGLVFSGFGVGLLIGSLVAMAWEEHAARLRVLHGAQLAPTAWLAAGSCACVIPLALASAPTTAMLSALLMGLFLGPVGPTMSGYARSVSGPEQAGRVMSVIVLSTDAMEPLGFLLFAALAVFGGAAAPAAIAATAAALWCARSAIGLRQLSRGGQPRHAAWLP